MPGLLFSQAVASLEAYGYVNLVGGVATTVVGTTQTGNGNFTITKTGLGKYALTLPAGSAQPKSRSLLVAQAYKNLSAGGAYCGIDQDDSVEKYIYTFSIGTDGPTLADFEFGFMLYANSLPNP